MKNELKSLEDNIIKPIMNKKPKIIINFDFTQKIKCNSPICDKCFLLVYISFDYIKNYIITYCFYYKDILIYTKDKFIEKIKENNNPLLNSVCKFCHKSFIFSNDNNNFYLIEEKINKFYILCNKGLDSNKYQINIKKFESKELLLHNLDLYDNGEKDYIFDGLNQTTNDLLKIKDEIPLKLNNFELFKNHISIIEEILKYYSLPFSIRKKSKKN